MRIGTFVAICALAACFLGCPKTEVAPVSADNPDVQESAPPVPAPTATSMLIGGEDANTWLFIHSAPDANSAYNAD
jgi:hypothetical protein